VGPGRPGAADGDQTDERKKPRAHARRDTWASPCLGSARGRGE
jgi:hypothetical protein